MTGQSENRQRFDQLLQAMVTQRGQPCFAL
jgi:hypothetical protein